MRGMRGAEGRQVEAGPPRSRASCVLRLCAPSRERTVSCLGREVQSGNALRFPCFPSAAEMFEIIAKCV